MSLFKYFCDMLTWSLEVKSRDGVTDNTANLFLVFDAGGKNAQATKCSCLWSFVLLFFFN